MILRAVLMTVVVLWVGTDGGRGAEPILGDYDAELRVGDHVDTVKMVSRLRQLGANTYMWLIWHNDNDWADLKKFLPLARRADIKVWVYLVPHSETALHDPRWPYSEPFRVDYVRWAQEIAKLSVKHENLVGYVIDDFWANVRPGRFTVPYIRKMVQAGKVINPKLKFYPLMYYRELNAQSVATLVGVIDGVVAAYPRDRQDIERARAFLNDEFTVPASVAVAYPWARPSKAGACGFIEQLAVVTDAPHARVSFRYEDDFAGATAGYHYLQLKVNDQVVWEEDVALADSARADVDLAELARGAKMLKLSIGICDKRGVSNFGVRAQFSDLRVTGLKLATVDIHQQRGWTPRTDSGFTIRFQPELHGNGRFHVPLIVMPAGCRPEFEKRYDRDGTPENIAAMVRVAVDLAIEQKVAGVVTYCLDKTDASADFEPIRKEFARAVAKASD